MTLRFVRRSNVRSITLSLLLGLVGCTARTIPPPRVSVPPLEDGLSVPLHTADAEKSMPRAEEEGQLPPPPFADSPLLNQRTPEQAAFVDAYARVGRPRIAIAVNQA